MVKVIFLVSIRAKTSDLLFLNSTAGRALMMGTIVWVLSRLRQRPMTLRIFGGDYSETYARYRFFVKRIADITFLRSSRVYVQTKSVARSFRARKNFRWLPNTRNVEVDPSPREAARRFLFVAQLRREKGLQETLEACLALPADCHLSVFGPVMPDTDLRLFDGHTRASYRGVLHPDAVPRVISQHDVLLLPSYFRAEGYPGVILEALQCGRPVISTWWKSIPEIVEHGRHGLLVAPRSSAELRDAILQLVENPALFRALCDGAERRGEFFRSGRWYEWLAKDISTQLRFTRH